MSEEKIHGLSLQQCAEIMSKDGELKAEFGERDYKPHLDQFLNSRGVTENDWAHAWNGWWQRMESDPSGQLHAKFHTMQSKLTMAAHMADVPDAGEREGVSLDTFAMVMAKMAAGEDAQQVVAGAGLEWAHWQKAQAAWNTAMAEDVNHHITTQYGQLYAKHTPGFEQQMQGQVAGMMAANYAERAAGVNDEPEREWTFDDFMGLMKSQKPAERYDAAHHISNMWDIGDREENPALNDAAAIAVPILVECLERHDDFTISNAESAARDLVMYAEQRFVHGDQAADLKSTMIRSLNRAQEDLGTKRAAFEPIRQKAVPERVHMQSAIQDTESFVETLAELLEDWDDAWNEAVVVEALEPVAAAPVASIAPAEPSAGIIDILKRLPVIGNIIRMLGL